MTDYGEFANLVATVTSLVAAGAAITLAFTKRSKWQPPEEAVSAAVSRIAALMTAIGIAFLYVFASKMQSGALAIVSACLFAATLLAVLVAISVNIRRSFYYPAIRVEENRVLGGSKLTPEAAKIHSERGFTEQRLFEDAQGDKDLVWTRPSQVSVNLQSTLSFIILIGAGGCALASAGALVATSIKP